MRGYYNLRFYYINAAVKTTTIRKIYLQDGSKIKPSSTRIAYVAKII